MQFFDNKGSNYDSSKEDVVFDSDGKDVEANKKNSEYYEKLMRDSASNKDGYYDKNNGAVRVILLVLGIFIILGTIFIVMRGTG